MGIVLTIAIPTYNRKNYLKRALDTIVPQINEQVEIYISDNASTDGTEDLIKEYSCVRYERNIENIGADKNFLKCYQQARGDYVLLLGSDDIVLPGAINEMVSILSANNYSLVFINHGFFENEKFDSMSFYLEPSKKCLITNSKIEFMNYATYQMTYMSAFIVSKCEIEKVVKPAKYIETSFIHTCCAFESSAGSAELFGIIFFPCVAQDRTPGNSTVSSNPGNAFYIFGKCMKYVLCEIAPCFGYDKRQMKRIFRKKIVNSWGKTIIELKAHHENREWIQSFWEFGYPSIKEFPEIWIKVMPALLIPKWIASGLFDKSKKIYRMVNRNKKHYYDSQMMTKSL